MVNLLATNSREQAAGSNNNFQKMRSPTSAALARPKPLNLAQTSAHFAQLESRLMATIVALCTQRTPFEQMDAFLPQLDVLRIGNSVEQQHQLAAALWEQYGQMVGQLPRGVQLDLDVILDALSHSLHTTSIEPCLAKNALTTIGCLASQVGFPFCAICPRLCALVFNAQAVPAGIRWEALKRVNEVLGVASQLHEYFPQLVAMLMERMGKGGGEMSSESELVELVASILRTSSVLLNVPLLVDLQKQVCLAALRPNPELGALQLLNALLENNHEGVPLPIQAATSVFSRDFSTQTASIRAEAQKGRALCQIYTRPRRIPCCAPPAPNEAAKAKESEENSGQANGMGEAMDTTGPSSSQTQTAREKTPPVPPVEGKKQQQLEKGKETQPPPSALPMTQHKGKLRGRELLQKQKQQKAASKSALSLATATAQSDESLVITLDSEEEEDVTQAESSSKESLATAADNNEGPQNADGNEEEEDGGEMEQTADEMLEDFIID